MGTDPSLSALTQSCSNCSHTRISAPMGRCLRLSARARPKSQIWTDRRQKQRLKLIGYWPHEVCVISLAEVQRNSNNANSNVLHSCYIQTKVWFPLLTCVPVLP